MSNERKTKFLKRKITGSQGRNENIYRTDSKGQRNRITKQKSDSERELKTLNKMAQNRDQY